MMNQHLYDMWSQRTIDEPIVFVGIGLHSGDRATMRLLPAVAGHGVSLIRRDVARSEQGFAVHWEAVKGSSLCTAVGNLFGHEVATIEHLLSALAALGIDNIAIELDGPEIPIMDGSALPFVEALENAGIRSLETPRDFIVMRRPVRLQQGASWAELLPGPGRRITVSIDFAARAIGTQTMSVDITPAVYRQEIAPATRKAVAVAVIENPFAGQYVEDLTPLMEITSTFSSASPCMVNSWSGSDASLNSFTCGAAHPKIIPRQVKISKALRYFFMNNLPFIRNVHPRNRTLSLVKILW